MSPRFVAWKKEEIAEVWKTQIESFYKMFILPPDSMQKSKIKLKINLMSSP